MNKKLIIPAALGATFVAGMAVVPNNVSAADGCIGVTDDTTFQNCIKDGGDVTLGKNFTGLSHMDVKNPVNLDLNGFNITSADKQDVFDLYDNGSLNITNSGTADADNGVITASGDDNVSAIFIRGGENVTVGQGVTLKGQITIGVSKNVTKTVRIVVDGTVIAENGKEGEALYAGEGIEKGKAPIFELGPTAVIKNANSKGAAIYQAGNSTFNINGATIEGGTGIVSQMGTLNIKDATITATGQGLKEAFKCEETQTTGNACNMGAAIQLIANEAHPGDINITIDGGTYTSANGAAIVEAGNDEDATSVKSIEVNGGTFTSAAGFDPVTGREVFDQANQEFIKGGKFLSGNKPADVPEEYIAKGLVEDPITGEVMTEIAYQELVESRKPHYPCKDFPTCWFASTEPNDTPSDPTEPSEPTNPSNPSDPTNPGDNNNGNANNGNANNGSTGSGSGDEGVVNPNTADSIAAYAGMVVVALLGLGATAASMIKSRKTA